MTWAVLGGCGKKKGKGWRTFRKGKGDGNDGLSLSYFGRSCPMGCNRPKHTLTALEWKKEEICRKKSASDPVPESLGRILGEEN